MSSDPDTVEAGRRDLRVRATGKGPLILAKLILSYLDKKNQGYGGDYGELVEKLSGSEMSGGDMGKWLQALRLCVSRLDEDCGQLVAATLRLPWYTQTESLVEVYLDYLANLLSAQVCHMEDALAALAQALLGPTAATRTTSEEVDDACYSNLHRGLQTLLEIVPRAAAQLVSALNKHYPFRTRGSDMQEVAVRNCLHVTTYCPTMTEDILCLLIKKMINIDAEIRLDDESSMELVIDEEGEPQFHVDMEQEPLMMSQGGGIHSTIGESSSTPGSETTPTENGCRGDEATPPHLGPSLSKHRVMRNDLSENLDIHMTVLQNHMKSVCFHDGQLVTEEAVALLQTLFKIFSNVILPTHAISHVQFLVFYLTSFHKEFPGVFLDFLWKKFQDVSSSAVLRQTTATYMASYIARSKFVSVETARLCLVHMMNWLHQYLDMCDPSTLGPFVARHGPFFSLCQSVFYIFVFRHQSLVEMENGLSFLRSLNFERIVSSKLNPLQVCLPSVVEKFSKLASRHELVFCYTILEANKRLMLLLAASLGTQSVTPTTNHLDAFFPFDPYFLHRSSEVIQPIYQEWEGVDEEEDEEEEREGEGEDGDGGEAGSLPSSSSASFLSVGLSCDDAMPTFCGSISEPNLSSLQSFKI